VRSRTDRHGSLYLHFIKAGRTACLPRIEPPRIAGVPTLGPLCATLVRLAQSWTGVDTGLLKSGRRRRITVPSGPSLGFAVLKDLLRLLWPFVYSPSSPLFLLALALELCPLAREFAAYVR
jgi:hypothetical protein